MALTEHLRELRNRLLKSIVALAAGAIVGWIFYDWIFGQLITPLERVIPSLVEGEDRNIALTLDSVTAPLFLQLKVALTAGVVLASPVWLYQLWAFIIPGLLVNERRWSLTFFVTAVPLFLGGVALAFVILPKGLQLLLQFTPETVNNFIKVDAYFSLVLRLLLLFGVAFELPIFIVLLNAIGLVSAATLRRWRSGLVFAIFVFAAVATPTGDPVTMLALALPMWLLFELAVLICRGTDRRRRRLSTEPDYEDLDDDEISELDESPTDLSEVGGDRPAGR